MANMPQSAPVIRGQDMPEELVRARMSCTNPSYRPILN
jgi:hypothetical protein